MEPTLTEFSYGYCVTEEFANRIGTRLKAAPYFPSLYNEGKYGGFDVMIGTAFFLQFKLCEKLTNRNATEYKNCHLDPTFFRFWLHRRNKSDQHQMLIDLEGIPGNRVYYIAPGFSDLGSLDSAYSAGAVVQNSAMFSPREIGPLPDDGYHRVSFRPHDDFGWFMSDPRRIKIHRRADIAKDISKLIIDDKREKEEWLNDLLTQMNKISADRKKIIDLKINNVAETVTQPSLLDKISYLARTRFGCEVLFLAIQR